MSVPKTQQTGSEEYHRFSVVRAVQLDYNSDAFKDYDDRK